MHFLTSFRVAGVNFPLDVRVNNLALGLDSHENVQRRKSKRTSRYRSGLYRNDMHNRKISSWQDPSDCFGHSFETENIIFTKMSFSPTNDLCSILQPLPKQPNDKHMRSVSTAKQNSMNSQTDYVSVQGK